MTKLKEEVCIACGGESHEDFWFVTARPCNGGIEHAMFVCKAVQEDFSKVYKFYDINLHQMKYFPDVDLLGTDEQYRERISCGEVFTRTFCINKTNVPGYSNEELAALMCSGNISKRIDGMLAMIGAYGPEALCDKPVIIEDEQLPLGMFNSLQEALQIRKDSNEAK